MKVVYDTCLYIDLLRSAKHMDLFTARHHIRFLSPIVLLELRAGVRTSKQLRVVERLLYPYSRAERIIRLEATHFHKAGEILSNLAMREKSIILGLSHDVLIAISAFSIGATLFTSNRKDFYPISRRLPFLKIQYM